MATRSTSLIFQRYLSGELNIQSYVVPAGRRTIVKWASINANAAGSVRCLINAVRGAVTARILTEIVLADSTTQRELWTVLNAGDILRVSNTGVGALDLTVSGAELIV